MKKNNSAGQLLAIFILFRFVQASKAHKFGKPRDIFREEYRVVK